MKMSVPVIVVFILVVRVTSEDVKIDKKVPNEDIVTVLKHVLKRLDTIEDHVKTNREETQNVRKQTQEVQKQEKANRAETQEVRKQVKANQEEFSLSLRNISEDVGTVKKVLTEGKSKTTWENYLFEFLDLW